MQRSVTEVTLRENPVIASNVGGMPEIVKDNETGYLCDMNNPDEWIERIHFLLNNPDVTKELGDNARRFVMKNFNWGKIAEDFIRILKKKADE